MNELKIFKNPEFGEVRTLTINGNPWFVGKDIAEDLGYQNGSRDINRLSADMSQFEYEERRDSHEDNEDLRTWTDRAKA